MTRFLLLTSALCSLLAVASSALLLAAPSVAAQAVVAQASGTPAYAGFDPCVGRLGRAELTQTTTSTYYRYYTPGEATVQVNVGGAVPQPGLYEVGVGTNLGRVLSLAGGPRLDVREENRRRTAEVHLFRPNMGPDPYYSTTIVDAASNPSSFPPLCEGDTVMIDVIEKRGFTWQDAGTILGGLSAVALLIQVLAGN